MIRINKILTNKSLQLLFIIILILCNSFSFESKGYSAQQRAFTDSSNIKIEIFKVDEGWGYDIFVNGQIYIHQPHIPAVKGEVHFPTKKDAHKAAKFVSKKIKNNIIPPAVTWEELDSLGIFKNSHYKHKPKHKSSCINNK